MSELVAGDLDRMRRRHDLVLAAGTREAEIERVATIARPSDARRDGLELALKGGQMGGADFFGRTRDGG